ncbi:MAG: NAD-dependent epimerase/dehydratase family protein [Verrucomicrobiales bacterium]
MKRILVTGAAGFIGSHTCERLVADGHKVLGVDNFRTGRRRNLAGLLSDPNFRLTELDARETEKLAEAAKEFGADGMLHLAALVSVEEGQRNPGLNHDLNINAAQSAVEAARLAGVGRIVFASSAAVYGDTEVMPIREAAAMPDPISLYGAAKLASEHILKSYARSYGLTAICLRYFNVFGERQDPNSPYSGVISIFSDRFAAGRQATIFGDGLQSRDFIHVSDIARANAAALTAAGAATGSYNVCTGQSTTLLDVVEVLKSVCPHAPEIAFGEARGGDIRHSLGDPSAARASFGFEAQRSFADGLRGLVEFNETTKQRQAA